MDYEFLKIGDIISMELMEIHETDYEILQFGDIVPMEVVSQNVTHVIGQQSQVGSNVKLSYNRDC